MTVLAIVLAASAAAVIVGGGPAIRHWPRAPRRVAAGGLGLGLPVVAGLAAGALLMWVDGTKLILALVLLGAVVGVARVFDRARGQKLAEERRGRVVQVCEAIVAELRAGHSPQVSLEHTLPVWSGLGPVVAAARLGADVPGALRDLADLPGATGLREVAAAWRVSEGSGAGLALALSQVTASIRERTATRQVVRAELASAQATARLVAVLPLGALAVAQAAGADPWHFLLETAPGLVCLSAGLVLVYCGLAWIDRIASAVLDR